MFDSKKFFTESRDTMVEDLNKEQSIKYWSLMLDTPSCFCRWYCEKCGHMEETSVCFCLKQLKCEKCGFETTVQEYRSKNFIKWIKNGQI